jgi:tRNA(Ile)-lysidine synthase
VESDRVLTEVRDFLAAHSIAGPVVVAVSGGIDSTALLVAFAELRAVPFEAAHVNHHLRGDESDGDEAFVRGLCARFGVTLHVFDGTLDPGDTRRSGVETAARNVRYARLKELGKPIATAHQKNDQAETVLMRLITGGGIAALRGIHPVREDGVIRPLLNITRAELSAFLAARGIVARDDSSNADPRFVRNRIRNVLAQLDASAINSLVAVAGQARDQWEFLEHFVDTYDRSTESPDETRFGALPDEPWLRRALLHRHIRRLEPGARDVSAADLERLANATASRISVTSTLELLRNGEEVILRRRRPRTAPFEVSVRADESVVTPVGRLQITSTRTTGRGQAFQLPKGAKPDFIVRNRRDGDRFQPLGMSRSRKLKDFLIDRKIAAEIRDQLPLLVWDDTIVWVAGVEISDAFKVDPSRAGDLYEASFEKDQEGVQRESDRGPRR